MSFGDFTAQAVYATRLKHIPTASFGTVFNDSRTRTVDDRGYIDLQYARPVGRRSDIIARVYWDAYQYDGWYVFGRDGDEQPGGAPVVNRDYARGILWGVEANVVHQLWTRDRLTLGADYRNNRQQDQVNFDEPPDSSVYLDDRRQSVVLALNLQNELRITRQLLLNTALRYEGTSSRSRSTWQRPARRASGSIRECWRSPSR
jgi:TonB-dependent receptor-like protein